jgi:hypothetical protein
VVEVYRETGTSTRRNPMNLRYELHTRRPRPQHRLLAILTLEAAALIIAAVLSAVVLSANGGLMGRHWISLFDGQSLGIGVFLGCPPTMPEMACLHIEHRFPPAFRVVYRSAGENIALVSIALPRR